MSGDLLVYDKPRSCRPQIVGEEVLKALIEDDNTQTCGEFPNASRFLMKHSDFTSIV